MVDAGLALTPPVTDGAAFHAQQAAEKLLKAFLVSRRAQFEKIHDLEVLAKQCAECDGAFSSIVAAVAPLTPFAVRFRYPVPGDPTVEEVQEAMKVVGMVRDLVVARIEATDMDHGSGAFAGGATEPAAPP